MRAVRCSSFCDPCATSVPKGAGSLPGQADGSPASSRSANTLAFLPSRLALALSIAACTVLAPSVAAARQPAQYYVSVGDSYAMGYQPGAKKPNRNGFAYRVPKVAAKSGYRLQLVNFGCGGATSASILNEQLKPGAKCLGADAPKFTGTQVSAVEKFLRANRRRVGLVTVSIGGNDFTKCAKEADAVGCVGTVMPVLQKNLETLLARVRRAAGPKVRIVGITYPDVILGSWVGDAPNQDIAKLSVAAFQLVINPTYKTSYDKVGATFVDVTAASGAYTPLDQTTTLAPYGEIPVAVARACELTYYCEQRDIHPKTPGYALIADLVAATLPKRG